MRPLALAGILAVLAGCSLPYRDTTFKATAPFKHATGEEGTGEAASSPAAPSSALSPDAQGVVGKTPTVFPNDAPPAGVVPDHGRTTSGE